MDNPFAGQKEALLRAIISLTHQNCSAYSGIEHLAKTVYLPNWRKVYLVMFTACFDASGHESDQMALAVAGFVAPASAWIDFDKQWSDRLHQSGLQYFRMSDFENARGQFKGWETRKPEREKLLRDLLGIIQGNACRKFGACIIHERFKRIIPSRLRKEYLLGAYCFAGRECAGQVRRWHRAGPPIELVFEHGDVGQGQLITRLVSDGFPPPIFKYKKDTMTKFGMSPGFTPLQAADILAYESFKLVKIVEQNPGKPAKLRFPMQVLDKMSGEVTFSMDIDLQRASELLRVTRQIDEWDRKRIR